MFAREQQTNYSSLAPDHSLIMFLILGLKNITIGDDMNTINTPVLATKPTRNITVI